MNHLKSSQTLKTSMYHRAQSKELLSKIKFSLRMDLYVLKSKRKVDFLFPINDDFKIYFLLTFYIVIKCIFLILDNIYCRNGNLIRLHHQFSNATHKINFKKTFVKQSSLIKLNNSKKKKIVKTQKGKLGFVHSRRLKKYYT